MDVLNIGKHMRAEQRNGQWTLTTRRGEVLGVLDWNERWRQFEFVPAFGSAFTSDCMRPLSDLLDKLTAEAVKKAAGGGA